MPKFSKLVKSLLKITDIENKTEKTELIAEETKTKADNLELTQNNSIQHSNQTSRNILKVLGAVEVNMIEVSKNTGKGIQMNDENSVLSTAQKLNRLNALLPTPTYLSNRQDGSTISFFGNICVADYSGDNKYGKYGGQVNAGFKDAISYYLKNRNDSSTGNEIQYSQRLPAKPKYINSDYDGELFKLNFDDHVSKDLARITENILDDDGELIYEINGIITDSTETAKKYISSEFTQIPKLCLFNATESLYPIYDKNDPSYNTPINVSKRCFIFANTIPDFYKTFINLNEYEMKSDNFSSISFAFIQSDTEFGRSGKNTLISLSREFNDYKPKYIENNIVWEVQETLVGGSKKTNNNSYGDVNNAPKIDRYLIDIPENTQNLTKNDVITSLYSHLKQMNYHSSYINIWDVEYEEHILTNLTDNINYPGMKDKTVMGCWSGSLANEHVNKGELVGLKKIHPVRYDNEQTGELKTHIDSLYDAGGSKDQTITDPIQDYRDYELYSIGVYNAITLVHLIDFIAHEYDEDEFGVLKNSNLENSNNKPATEYLVLNSANIGFQGINNFIPSSPNGEIAKKNLRQISMYVKKFSGERYILDNDVTIDNIMSFQIGTIITSAYEDLGQNGLLIQPAFKTLPNVNISGLTTEQTYTSSVIITALENITRRISNKSKKLSALTLYGILEKVSTNVKKHLTVILLDNNDIYIPGEGIPSVELRTKIKATEYSSYEISDADIEDYFKNNIITDDSVKTVTYTYNESAAVDKNIIVPSYILSQADYLKSITVVIIPKLLTKITNVDIENIFTGYNNELVTSIRTALDNTISIKPSRSLNANDRIIIQIRHDD
jgi:hypothetical protein